MTRVDRADELRSRADLWPEIAPHLGVALWEAVVEFESRGMRFSVAEFEAKFRRGELEHERDWLDLPAEWFGVAIGEEILDAVLYCAMRRARFSPVPVAPFVSHRDLGDEQEPAR